MRNELHFGLWGLSWLLALATAQAQNLKQDPSTEGMVYVPAGSYVPFFATPKKEPKKIREKTRVEGFWIDPYAVTKKQYLEFLRSHPKWRRSNAREVFADTHYLHSWKSDLALPGGQSSQSPVTEISWFAAQAYCRAQGKSLPTVDQWEYAADDQGRGIKEGQRRILEWYSHPNTQRLSVVGSAGENGLGIHDMHGLIWEWTLDFNGTMVSDESRDSGTTDGNLFCGSGSLGALDASDYASFMRYSFRSSLKANYTTANLGFRCVREEIQ